MPDLVEQINEARKVVEELGGKKTKSLDDLKGELDRMIEASKQPGYSPNDAETLIKKRALVVSAMETALHVLVNETLDETAASTETATEIPTKTSSVPEASTQSAFAPTTEGPKPSTQNTDAPATTTWQKFVTGTSSVTSQGFEGFKGFLNWAGKGIGDFWSYASTSIVTLWNSWFGKKDTTTNQSALPVATGTTSPEVPRPYDEAPDSQSPATNEPPIIAPQDNKPAPAQDTPPENDPLVEKPLDVPPNISFDEFKKGLNVFGETVRITLPNIITVGTAKWAMTSNGFDVNIDNVEWQQNSLTVGASAKNAALVQLLKMFNMETQGSKTLDRSEAEKLFSELKTSTTPKRVTKMVDKVGFFNRLPTGEKIEKEVITLTRLSS